MSKSRGNVVDPSEVFARHGADALRWYFFSAGSPWTSRRMSDEGIAEAARATLLTLWNVLAFFAGYADLDGWEPTEDADRARQRAGGRAGRTSSTGGSSPSSTTPSRRSPPPWRATTRSTAAGRLGRFVDDLSNWYVRRSRRRFWKAAEDAAHATLHHVLVQTARLLAPFCPFLADEVHRTLLGGPLGAPGRLAAAVGPAATPRWPSAWPPPAGWSPSVGRPAPTPRSRSANRCGGPCSSTRTGCSTTTSRRQIAEELNVKALEDVDTLSDLLTWKVTPNFRMLGPRLGPRLAEVKAALEQADGERALQRALDAGQTIEVAGVELSRDDVELRATRHSSFALAEDGGWAVALDLDLDDDLRREGAGPRARPGPQRAAEGARPRHRRPGAA